MGLFNRNKKEDTTPREPGNPTIMIGVRALAVFYLLWTVKDLVELYIEGGPDAPSLGALIAACAFFVIGSAVIAVLSVKQYKRMKVERDEYNEMVAEQYRLEEEAAARAKAEEAEDYEEYEEIDEEYEETEETEE